jgi:cytochrome c oxidase assembly protein subunit 15
MGHNAYLKLNWLSIFFIFLLFVIGGLVRSTGSGMGCPDWPKCFGEYVPPTSESELPVNYEDFFTNQRVQKTERFVSLLKKIGLTDKAAEIENNTSLNESHQFNVLKAYVEYINRLWGAVTGIIVFACFLLSIPYLRNNKKVFIFTTLGFISVFLNALLGAVVVNSNLIGGIVTAHFIAAFASICFFIIARHFAQPFPSSILTSGQKRMAFFLMILIAIQVILGAELRELYDVLNQVLNFGEKTNALAPTFQYHGLLGILTAIMAIYQLIKIPKTYKSIKYVKWIAILAVAQLGFGPMALLPETASISKLFHISFGAAIFVLQFYICTAFISTSKSER